MLAQVVRSGVVESTHEGAVAVVAPDGSLIASDGDIDRTYFIRSSAKPFQALAALRAGASFTAEELAIACASHGAYPIHVAYVEKMLAADGLSVSDLRCPPGWPIAAPARDSLMQRGHEQPRAEWYNCSGKHAGMLRACVAAGWPTETYLDPAHPLQVLIRSTMEAAMDVELAPPGVDGCGAPVYEVSTRHLARGYATLATAPEYAEIGAAMARYGALTASTDLMSAASRYWGQAAKGGAEGCIGLAMRDRFGLAIKSFDGSERPLGPALLESMLQLEAAPVLTLDRYRPAFDVVVQGGGIPVGSVEPRVKLSWN